jgi:hypothetical protein
LEILMKKRILMIALLMPAAFVLAMAAQGDAPRHSTPAQSGKRTDVLPTIGTVHATSSKSVAWPAATKAADELLRRWSGHVQTVYGTAPEQWAQAMRPTLARLSEKDLRRATTMPSFDAMMAALTPQPTSVQSTTASWQSRMQTAEKLLATTSSSLAYNMLVPCRIVDTRNAGTRLKAGTVLNINSAGSDFTAQGGHAGDCGVPANASAVVINITAVNPAIAGYLTVYPYNTTLPVASSLNYGVGQIVGNEVIAKQTLGQAYAMSIYSHGEVDVVADVVGFFADAPATGLICERVIQHYNLPAGNYGSGFAECPYIFGDPKRASRMGGSCAWTSVAPGAAEPGQLNGSLDAYGWYMCDADNTTTADASYMVTAICCRVPRH